MCRLTFFPEASSWILGAGGALLRSSPIASSPRTATSILIPRAISAAELFVLLDATWQGSRIAWCPYAYADNDAAIMRGWVEGYPKKLGAVHQTRTFAATSAASAPLVNKSSFAGCVSAHGQLLAEARVILRERADHLVGLLDRPVVARRYFPQLCAGVHHKPVVDELVRCTMNNLLIANLWVGEGELIFPETHGEELDMLGPIKVGRGFRFSFSCSISDCTIFGRLDRLAIARQPRPEMRGSSSSNRKNRQADARR